MPASDQRDDGIGDHRREAGERGRALAVVPAEQEEGERHQCPGPHRDAGGVDEDRRPRQPLRRRGAGVAGRGEGDAEGREAERGEGLPGARLRPEADERRERGEDGDQRCRAVTGREPRAPRRSLGDIAEPQAERIEALEADRDEQRHRRDGEGGHHRPHRRLRRRGEEGGEEHPADTMNRPA